MIPSLHRTTIIRYIKLVVLFLNLTGGGVAAEDTWRFVVFADWHGAEGFATTTDENDPNYKLKLEGFSYVNSTFGGELALLPGDVCSGKWNTDEQLEKWSDLGFDLTPQQSVLKAGTNLYPTLKKMFSQAGYDTILVSTGDHEYGGNGWGKITADSKTQSYPIFKQTISQGLNRDPDTGDLLFTDKIGTADSIPYGTPYEDTSYAYRYKNALFITVDAFHMVNQNKPIYKRGQGVGGEGVITCTVEGQHLQWFENVLQAASQDDTIKHIFVQAHLPIIQPVRKVNCSGQFLDHGENSNFWKTMRKYNVDVYFAGEVHTNTATQDTDSNLVQLVTRANRLNNLLTVDVSDDRLVFTSYNEVDNGKAWNNLNYTHYGELVVDKSASTTTMSSSGSLKLLNRKQALLSFDFESIHHITDRQVLGLKEDNNSPDVIIPTSVEIRGKTCTEAIWNDGVFTEQYDMQIGGITLVPGIVGQSAAQFNLSSKAGVWGIGPHGPGNTISYTLWIKTDESNAQMILLHYGMMAKGMKQCFKDEFNLFLDYGVPTMYRCNKSKLVPVNKDISLSDGMWHHIAVSMPFDNCRFSNVKMYIDGEEVKTEVVGNDARLFFITNGRMGIGGFGHTISDYEDIYPDHTPFVGTMDDVRVYGRQLFSKEVSNISRKKFKINQGYACSVNNPSNVIDTKVYSKVWTCSKKCASLSICSGFEITKKNLGTEFSCTLFSTSPKVGSSHSKKSCAALP